MKKISLILTIMALAFAALCFTGCGDDYKDLFNHDDGNQSQYSAFIGTWYGTGTDSSYTLVIGVDDFGMSGSWSLTDGSDTWSDNWSGSGNVLNFAGSDSDYDGSYYLYNGTAILSGSNLSLSINLGTDKPGSSSKVTIVFTKSASSGTSMTIKNESSYDLSDVTWAGLKFVTSGQTADLLKGTIAKKDTAEDASGYIYFTRKDIGIELRTQAIATADASPVTINNTTVVVQIGNETNTGALSQITKPVVAPPTLTWSGSWVETAPNSYYSNPIGHSAETWEKLTINAPSACTITVNLSSSSYSDYYVYYDYGYASYLDGSPSPSQYRLRVYGTSGSTASGTYDYAVPAGTHYIYFGYVKDYTGTSGQDRIYVSVTVK
jgi:hypothetical protein